MSEIERNNKIVKAVFELYESDKNISISEIGLSPKLFTISKRNRKYNLYSLKVWINGLDRNRLHKRFNSIVDEYISTINAYISTHPLPTEQPAMAEPSKPAADETQPNPEIPKYKRVTIDELKVKPVESIAADFEKLQRRIKREIKKCTYLGDVAINDAEYALLIKYTAYVFNNYLDSTLMKKYSPVISVTLVQIGMRKYNGSFWNHVSDILEIKLSGQHQKWIGTLFYLTLIIYNKCHVEENEFMNNILMHCFITEHFAPDLFDFLFAYYQIDLERDLSRNNKDMRNYLMQSMSKGENTARAYKIKKHTSDAVSANEHGCKIRVGKILRFMDNALFEGVYPTSSQNRIAQMFCKWAETSKKFDHARKAVSGLNKKGEKRFSSPYLHFDGNNASFQIILPPQYIHLLPEEDIPELSWKISCAENEYVFAVDAESCVTGCKTQKNGYNCISAEHIHENIKIELVKNNTETVHKFHIYASSIRFFDKNWDLVNFSDNIPVGQLYAFTKSGEVLISDSDAIFECEKMLGMDLYSLDLAKGDILRLPDGRAISAGKPLEDGILKTNLVSGAYVIHDDSKLQIYSKVPSLYFKMNQSKENGTLIVINGKPNRFDIEKCIKCSAIDKSDEKGYILKLSEYIQKDGIYNITLDIPGSRKMYDYTFAIINGYGFEYEGAPYIFKEMGAIRFFGEYEIIGEKTVQKISDKSFSFSIEPDIDFIPFQIKTSITTLAIRIYLPAFKWKFDDDNWNILPPNKIWHTEFPKFIYFKFPDDSVILDMPPLLTNDSDDEDSDYSIEVVKNKEQHLFVCDTRKIISWFGFEDIMRPLSLHFESYPAFKFIDIVTHCFIEDGKVEAIEDREQQQLRFKSKVIGFADCVADVYRDGKLIAEKITVYSSGIKLKSNFISGTYKIDYFEADEEDDFGFSDYRKFDSRICKYTNKRDLTDKTVILRCIAKYKKADSIFAASTFQLMPTPNIDNISVCNDEPDTFLGTLHFGNHQRIRVKFKFHDINTMSAADIWFWSDEYEEYTEFLYDKQTLMLAIAEDESLTAMQARERYLPIFNDTYYYDVQIKRL